MRLFLLMMLVALQGSVLAFNPIKSIVKMPFRVVKLAGKAAMMPVKLAVGTGKKTIKTTAMDRVAAFAINKAPYKDLALMAL